MYLLGTDDGILVLTGPPCSGKSSVGRILAREFSAGRRPRIHIEVDALFSLVMPMSERSRADRMLAYEAAHLLARLFVERGNRVVLECTYARSEQRLSLLNALVEVPEVPLWVVEFFISPDDAVTRFRRRQEATDLDEESVRERADAFPYFEGALRLTSAANTPDQLAAQIATWSESQPRPTRRESWAAAGRAWG